MTTLNLQVGASTDDAYEDLIGNITTNSSQFFNTVNNPYAGTRYTNVTIPQGTTITSATLKIGLYSATCTTSPNCVVKFYCADEDNVATWGAGNKLSTRTPTTAFTNYTNTSFFGGPISGCAVSRISIDVTSAVQEVINRGTWSSGNALGVISQTQGLWWFRSQLSWDAYDNAPGCSSILEIKYGEGRRIFKVESTLQS